MVGNSYVRVSAEYPNSAPPQPLLQSYGHPGHSVTLSNPGCAPQPHIFEDSTDEFEAGNKFFDPIAYSYKEDTIGAQTVPQTIYLDQFSENSLTGSRTRYMQAMPGGPTAGSQLSVAAPFQTPGQNNLASVGDEWSVTPSVIGHRRFSPNPHPKDNLHGINIQHVLGSEEFEQLHSPSKTKHLVGVPSPFLPGYTWRYTSEESLATPIQCWPPFPLRIWWKLALQHLQGKELLVRCRSSAVTYYMKR